MRVRLRASTVIEKFQVVEEARRTAVQADLLIGFIGQRRSESTQIAITVMRAPPVSISDFSVEGTIGRASGS